MGTFGISSGAARRPQRVVVYGMEGVGKTTFAAGFPGAVFVDLEHGSDHMDVARVYPAPETWGQLLACVGHLSRSLQPGSTLVVDTADAADAMCARHVCEEGGKPSVESFGYGKGYVLVADAFRGLLSALDAAVGAGSNVVLLAHSRKETVTEPNLDSYNAWGMKLSKQVAPLVKEWCDALLFATFDKRVVEGADSRARVYGGERALKCTHSPTFDAKNRWGLPDSVPFEFSSVAAHVPAGWEADVGAAIEAAGTTWEAFGRALRTRREMAEGLPRAEWSPDTARYALRWKDKLIEMALQEGRDDG